MKFSFEPSGRLILVDAEIYGPHGSGLLRLALDTGATTSLIDAAMFEAIGYNPTLATDRVQITTGSGLVVVPRVSVHRLFALGKEEQNFPILCHTLPANAAIDGVLGLDFLRDQVVTIDFRLGFVELS